ncbi:MAG: oligosaccharide flippase family protein [Oscillospiraceae bacterium]|jgi:stage V sporulation protein B|nr:oligosaccharide flippase family protein [Oscillospiraceae bacterium]
MLKDRPLLKNTLIMTAVALAVRGIGIAFQSYITSVIGAEGVGLFALVQSAFTLALTFATSGIRYAVTRLIAEKSTLNPAEVAPTMRKAFAYACVCSVAAALALYFGADLVASHWIHDDRVAQPLRVMALGLPFIALTAVTGGYFSATWNVRANSASYIFDQVVMLAAVFLLLPRTHGGVAESIIAIVTANLISNAAGLAFGLVLYIHAKRGASFPDTPIGSVGKLSLSRGNSRDKATGKLVATAVPIALSAYFRTALNTVQHMLIPIGLRSSGLDASASLAAHGVLHGMVFPVLMFPSVLMVSAADLLIPELTAAQVAGRNLKVHNIVTRILKLSFAFSLGCAAVLFTFGGVIGRALYNSDQAGNYIRLLAPLVVVMYMDMITDGLLKGLGQQLYSMYVNIADSAVSCLLVWQTLPIWGIKAYIFMIVATELFNFALSLHKLRTMLR